MNLFSGSPADPPSADFIMRNAMDAQEVAVGWWPGISATRRAAFYAYAHPAPQRFRRRALSPAAGRWDEGWASTSSTGTTSAPAPTRTKPRSTSLAPLSATPALFANGTRAFLRVPREHLPRQVICRANSKWQDETFMLGTARDEIAPLLGRAYEQTLLASLLEEVNTRGQALVLRGEPGIGKSRLLSEVAREARERGMAVLAAAGVQSEAHLPFAGLHQMLRPVRERADGLPAIQREALDAAFGLSDAVAPEPYRIAMAALDLVSEVATDVPVLLVVDDAHWLDRPTADVLAFVARRIESDPVLLLAAVRDGYPSPLTDAGLPEHRLTGLDDATAGALLDAAAPRLPLAARNRALREAAGNPLALLELPGTWGPTGESKRSRRSAADRASRARVRRSRL